MMIGWTLLCARELFAQGLSAGPFASEFSLTLAQGRRSEAVGTLLRFETTDETTSWAFTPLMSHTRDFGTDSEEFDLVYPLLTYDRFGAEYRWQLFQLFSFSGGANAAGTNPRRFTLFPFYFQQRSSDPALNYTALLPFYGTIRNHFFRDEVRWIMFPGWVQTKKKDLVTDNYMAPFFHIRHGDHLQGWQLWPVVGRETKVPYSRTNSFGEVEMIPGHNKFFAVWPFFANTRTELGATNPVHQQVLLPFYSLTRSPMRDSTTLIWPFFTYTVDREKGYHEWGLPWPLIGFARGTGKRMDRVWPFFSHATNAVLRSDWYAWPLYKYNRAVADPLFRERHRVLFFLYSDLTEKDMSTGRSLRRTDLWPLFTAFQDREGNQRFQMLSILEPLLPANKSIERNYSPFWGGLWRREYNGKTGALSRSFGWNLWRQDEAEGDKKCSLLFGLIQYQSTQEGASWRLFYLPPGIKNPPTSSIPKSR